MSSCTKRVVDCIVPPGSTYINCHSSNVVYLITCDNCFIQYVGETVQKINKRFNWHRTGLKNPEKYGFCRILSEHFNNGVCKGASYTVQILEKLEGNGRTPRGAIDPSQTAHKKSREMYWMLQLRTIYPYGLNDPVGDEYKREDSHHLVANRFPPLSRKHPRASRGLAYRGNNLTSTDFFNKLTTMLKDDLPNTLNYIRVSIASLKKSELKRVANLINDKINERSSNAFDQWYFAALDLIESKIYKPPKIKEKRPSPENICNVHFSNKGIEAINLTAILNHKDVVSCLPSGISKFDPPTVVYNLSRPINSKIFNFNKFV